MLSVAEELLRFTEGKSYQDLLGDRGLQHICVHCLELLGEAASQLPPEFRGEHPDLPWAAITAMRNRLIHGYFDLELAFVWGAIAALLCSATPASPAAPAPSTRRRVRRPHPLSGRSRTVRPSGRTTSGGGRSHNVCRLQDWSHPTGPNHRGPGTRRDDARVQRGAGPRLCQLRRALRRSGRHAEAPPQTRRKQPGPACRWTSAGLPERRANPPEHGTPPSSRRPPACVFFRAQRLPALLRRSLP